MSHPPLGSPRLDRRLAWVLAIYFGAFLGLEVLTAGFRRASGVNLWFPAPALTMTLMLAFGRRLAWAPFLVHLPYALVFSQTTNGLALNLAICLAHGGVYGLGTLYAIQRGMGARLVRFRHLTGFLLYALLSSGAMGLLLAWILHGHFPGGRTLLENAAAIWAGDALGLLCLGPFLLTWVMPTLIEAPSLTDPSPLRVMEGLLQGLSLVVTGIVIILVQRGQVFPLKYLAFLPLVWIALRWGARGAAVGALGMGVVTLSGFLAMGYSAHLLEELQGFLLFTFPITLLLGSLADERTHGGRARRALAARLASILRATGSHPFELDRGTGETLSVDPHLNQLLGVTPPEWNRQPFWAALLHPADRERFRAFCEGSLQGSLDVRLRTGSGNDQYLQVIAGTRSGDRISGILLNVHAHREAQQRLEASEALYRATVESIEEGIVVRDLAGRVRSMNESARRIFGGLPPGEQEGPGELESLDEHGEPLPWEDQPPLMALRKRIAIHAVMGLRRAGEETRWITVRSRPLWKGTELQGVVSSILDVTEERRAIEALRASEARYRLLVEQSLIPTAIHQDGRFVYLNDATLRLFGAEVPEDLLGHPVLEHMHPEERAESIQRLQALARGEVEVLPPTERRLIRLDGREVVAELIVMGTQFEGRPAVQVMAVDITARKAMEAGLQESLRQKDLTIREIHHRVKNNLQVVSSLLRLQAGSSPSPEVRDALTEARERIQAIALVHARLHNAPALAEADLRDYLVRLVSQLIRSYAPSPLLVDANVEVADLRLGPDDLVPLALVLHELVLNALRHGFGPEEGGALRISLQAEAEGQLTLQVEDDGHGLPEGLDPLQGGGLGFQLIRALADQLRGTLQVVRRKGAAFRLTFTPRPLDPP